MGFILTHTNPKKFVVSNIDTPPVPRSVTLSLLSFGIQIEWVCSSLVGAEIEVWRSNGTNNYELVRTVPNGLYIALDAPPPYESTYYKLRRKQSGYYSIFTDPVSIVTITGNLITNGKFTTNISGWAASGGNITAARETTIFQGGGIRVVKGSDNEVGFTQQLTGLTNGVVYEVSCRAYAPSTNTVVNGAVISDYNKPNLAYVASSQVTAENTIQTLSFDFTASGTTANIYLLILNRGVAWGTSGDVAIFDDIIVTTKTYSIDEKSRDIIIFNTELITEVPFNGMDTMVPSPSYGFSSWIRDLVMTSEKAMLPQQEPMLIEFRTP
jgi:hypothetical protein